MEGESCNSMIKDKLPPLTTLSCLIKTLTYYLSFEIPLLLIKYYYNTHKNYIRYGREKSVKCSKEVIVSAGTINSAKLLSLSGKS